MDLKLLGLAVLLSVSASAQGEWTTGVWLNDDATSVVTNIESDSFNNLFSACPVVQYTRNGAVYAVYVRTSPVTKDFNAFSVFTDTWASKDNLLNIDFKLYNTLEDAKEDKGAWQVCNYDDNDVGFPRDCGQNATADNRWFSMPGGRFNARGIMSGVGFDIYSGSSCPAPGCLKEYNIDYEGKNINDGRQNSMEDCAKWCGKEPKCKFWTYRKSDNRCWLKHSNSGRKENTKVMSGTKNCGTVDVVALKDTVAILTTKLEALTTKVDAAMALAREIAEEAKRFHVPGRPTRRHGSSVLGDVG